MIMPYREQIRKLTVSHNALDTEIKRLEMLSADQDRITELRRRKLMFKNELSKLHKLQWEEDHERVKFDD